MTKATKSAIPICVPDPSDLTVAQMQAFVDDIRRGRSRQRNTIEDSYQLNRIIQQIKDQMGR
ncbi:MAG: hypothetical protein CR984_03130 [Proteobacteria bacterium]|nr:MAG: hypothetical protein CR984_03130 [Pseudomonadota bacterium]